MTTPGRPPSRSFPSLDGPMVEVPRGLLRDACTRLYGAGDDVVREHLERYAYPDENDRGAEA